MALEDEIQKWRGFAKALRSDERQAFEALIDACRSHASASSNTADPVIFEPMVMSIVLNQQIQLTKLERKLDDALQKQQSAQA